MGIKKSKRPPRRARARLGNKIKLFLKLNAIFAVLGIVGVGGVFAYYAEDLPSPASMQELKIAESTKIYDKTGKILLYEIHGEQKRTIIPLDEVPPYVKEATIVAEDDDFYNHFGIDLAGIARAVLTNLKRQTVLQGGSTITQQLIKNMYLSPERTLARKVKEVILAVELELKYSKEEILAFYLNAVPYGSNAYGIEAAAQTFFNKHAPDLTLAESALLASLPKAPTYYSPFGNNPDKLEARHAYVLDRMYELGYITDEELASAYAEKISYSPSGNTGIKAPHFVMYVREHLQKEYGEEYLKNAGLSVVTTLDWDLQQAAEEIVREWGDKNEKRFGAQNAALIALDPSSGHILAMVGSRDYFDVENDGNVNVTNRLRQPGSSFKPFGYAAAFEKGYTPDTLIFDVETNFGVQGTKEYIPKNYDEKFRGPITFKEALAQSINVPAVKVLYLAGIRDTIQLAKNLGITSLTDPTRYGLSLVLGGGEVTLLEETSAYGVFAQEGIRNAHTPILSIVSNTGEILEEFTPSPNEVLDPQIARLITSILASNDLRAPVFGERNYLSLGSIPSAAKTGTTQEYRDAWTVGYTPDIAVGVWVGNNDNTQMHDAAGSKAAAPIWYNFMKKAYEITGWDPRPFTPPASVTTQKPILNGILPSEPHSLLYFIKKDDPQGPPPISPEGDPQFQPWEEAIHKWVQEELLKRAEGNATSSFPFELGGAGENATGTPLGPQSGSATAGQAD